MILVLLWLRNWRSVWPACRSAQHLDGSVMMQLAEWAQRIVTFRPGQWSCCRGELGVPGRTSCSAWYLLIFLRAWRTWSGFGTSVISYAPTRWSVRVPERAGW